MAKSDQTEMVFKFFRTLHFNSHPGCNIRELLKV